MKIFTSTSALFAAAAFACGSAFGLDSGEVDRALSEADDRPAADMERDANRKPGEVLEFLGLEEGMTVLDVMASSGWYTEVLSHAVGPDGMVYMQNSPASLGMRGTEEAVQERLSGDRLGNVQRVDRNFEDLSMDIEPGSVDFAITALNFHDIYNRDPQAAQDMLSAIHEVLKDGGTLGLIDHEGDEGANNADLHRIALSDVVASVTEAGFAVVGISDALDVEADDHTLGPFDPSLERNTDRLVLKLMKI